MSTELATIESPRDRVAAWLTKHNVTIEADFIPYSKSRNAGKWESLNWRVTIKRGDRAIITTDYSAGIGHTPAHKVPLGVKSFFGTYDKRVRDLTARNEIETGRASRPIFNYGDRPVMSGFGKPILPDPCDVIVGLAMDSDVLDYGVFADWCDSFGYNSDSIKDRATYDACLEIALKLHAGLGDAAMAELREASADY